MYKNLENYIKVYDNSIDTNICKQTVLELQNSTDWQQHVFYNNISNIFAPREASRELDVSFAEVSTRNSLNECISLALKKYIDELNFSWFTTFKAHTYPRYNRYNSNKLMALHCDHIHSMFDGNLKGIPILTVIGLLNENYSGGELILFEDSEIGRSVV